MNAPPPPPPSGGSGKVLTIAVLAAVAMAGWALQATWELLDAQSENAQLQQSLAVLSRRQPALGPFIEETKALRVRVAELEAQLAAAAAPAAETPPAEKPKTALSQMAVLMDKNPAMREMLARQQEQAVALVFGPLLDHFQLTPADRANLQKLLLERQMNQVDYGMKALDANLTADQRATLGQQLQAANNATDAEVGQFLNNDNDYAYYQTYLQQQPERTEAQMFNSSLARSGEPLSSDQTEALVGLMYDARKNFKFTQNFYDQGSVDPPTMLNDTAMATFAQEQEQLQNQIADRAAAILTPAQLAVFRQNQAGVRQLMQTQLSVARQMIGGGQ